MNNFGSGRTIRWKRSRPSPQDGAALAKIVAQFAWPSAQMAADPRGIVTAPVHEHWRLQLALMPDDDIVWIGRDVRDTGRPSYKWRFRRAADWQGETQCPGVFVCPNAFKPEVHSRSDANVATKRYLVVESDELHRDEIGAVFRLIEKAFSMRLRAVVDTAGKSLHGWFEYPTPEVIGTLSDLLPRLKCDPAMFAPSQPCRLAGALRDGHYQRLIFLDGNS